MALVILVNVRDVSVGSHQDGVDCTRPSAERHIMTSAGMLKTIRENIEGDTWLEQDVELHGIILGSVIVPAGRLFHVCGAVSGSVHLEARARVFLYGYVGGDVVNNGGCLELYGVVNGRVIRQAGTTRIDRQALVYGGLI